VAAGAVGVDDGAASPPSPAPAPPSSTADAVGAAVVVVTCSQPSPLDQAATCSSRRRARPWPERRSKVRSLPAAFGRAGRRAGPAGDVLGEGEADDDDDDDDGPAAAAAAAAGGKTS